MSAKRQGTDISEALKDKTPILESYTQHNYFQNKGEYFSDTKQYTCEELSGPRILGFGCFVSEETYKNWGFGL